MQRSSCAPSAAVAKPQQASDRGRRHPSLNVALFDVAVGKKDQLLIPPIDADITAFRHTASGEYRDRR